MKHGGLSKASKCLVRALDNHVGARIDSALGKVRVEVEVRPVGLVDQNTTSCGVRFLNVVVDVRADAEVVRIGHEDGLGFRMIAEYARERFLGWERLELQQAVLFGLEVDGTQFIEDERSVHRAVRVALHDDAVVGIAGRENHCLVSNCRTIDEEERFYSAVGFSS